MDVSRCARHKTPTAAALYVRDCQLLKLVCAAKQIEHLNVVPNWKPCKVEAPGSIRQLTVVGNAASGGGSFHSMPLHRLADHFVSSLLHISDVHSLNIPLLIERAENYKRTKTPIQLMKELLAKVIPDQVQCQKALSLLGASLQHFSKMELAARSQLGQPTTLTGNPAVPLPEGSSVARELGEQGRKRKAGGIPNRTDVFKKSKNAKNTLIDLKKLDLPNMTRSDVEGLSLADNRWYRRYKGLACCLELHFGGNIDQFISAWGELAIAKKAREFTSKCCDGGSQCKRQAVSQEEESKSDNN